MSEFTSDKTESANNVDGYAEAPEADAGQSSSSPNQTSFYDLLEVSPNATQKQIKAQFLALSLKYHPDKETGDPQKFKSLMQAYKVLSSKKRRKTYDNSLSNTWDELREAKRDVEYKTTEKHTKLNDKGERVFDEKSFHAAFDTERNDADADEIKEMLQELETSGRVVEKDHDKQVDAWTRLQMEREAEEKLRAEQVEMMEGGTLEDLRQDFNPNIFNQMFADMKAKKTELVDYDMRNEDEFLQYADQGEMGMWQGQGGVGGSMFGGTMGSNMGGLEALGGLRGKETDDHIIREFGNRKYEYRPEVTYTREVTKEDSEAQLNEYEKRIAEIEAERKELQYMDKNDYIIRDSVIAEALGDLADPSIFDDSIPALDPGLSKKAKEEGDSNVSEDTENDGAQDEADDNAA